jgi:hypothetical protein
MTKPLLSDPTMAESGDWHQMIGLRSKRREADWAAGEALSRCRARQTATPVVRPNRSPAASGEGGW